MTARDLGDGAGRQGELYADLVLAATVLAAVGEDLLLEVWAGSAGPVASSRVVYEASTVSASSQTRAVTA